jgi:hypothetical protein
MNVNPILFVILSMLAGVGCIHIATLSGLIGAIVI